MGIFYAERVGNVIEEFFKERFRPWRGDGLVPPELRHIHTSLTAFFSDKSWFCGGPVPPQLIFTQKNFYMLHNIPLVKAFDIAFHRIDQTKTLARTTYHENIDTELSMRIVRECEMKQIPREHTGGLFLAYLELCENVDMP